MSVCNEEFRNVCANNNKRKKRRKKTSEKKKLNKKKQPNGTDYNKSFVHKIEQVKRCPIKKSSCHISIRSYIHKYHFYFRNNVSPRKKFLGGF